MKKVSSQLFVYGTLLRGEPNHRALGQSRFLSSAVTPPVFTLYDLGEYPGLVAGGTDAVAGELYEVDRETLRELDHFEGHPDLFERKAMVLGTRQEVQVYLIAHAPVGALAIEGGDWRRRHRKHR